MMRDAKEEVRQRLSVEDVVGEYVSLKRSGRNFKGLSPFTDEKTPSFVVSPDKQIWHDFSSGQGGDIFSFVMLMEGMDFRQSLEHLARKANVEIEEFDSQKSAKIKQQKERAYLTLDMANRFFMQVLERVPPAKDYVTKNRHFSPEIIAEFKIGYAPKRAKTLITALQGRQISLLDMRQAGLLNQYDGDLFRDRITIALSDPMGRVIGFTGRSLTSDVKSPKYLNTPQTILFNKSNHIFGLFQAKEAIRKSGFVVIVEGNLDVVSSHQAGVKNVVATAGTAMTETHLKSLARLTPRIRLAFDGDGAGLSATERAISLAQNIKIELEIISLPPTAKDPDELIQQDPKLWQRAINNAIPAVEWVIKQHQKRQNLATAEGKRRFTDVTLELIKTLKDPVEKEHYLTLIQQITDISMSSLEKKLANNLPTEKVKLKYNSVKKQPARQPHYDLIELALGIALQSAAARQMIKHYLDDFATEKPAQQLLQFLKDHPDQNYDELPPDLQNIDQYVKIIQVKSEMRYDGWQDSQLQAEMGHIIEQITTKNRQNKKHQLMDQLREAEEKGDDNLAATLRQQINQLIKEK